MLSLGTYAFCCLPIICGMTFLILFVITQLASLYITDRRLIGLKFEANVGSFSPFLKSLKIAVLRVIVKIPFALLVFIALVTKAPSGVQNSRMKFTVNPSIPGAEFPFMSSLRALVSSCSKIAPSSESLVLSSSFLELSSFKGSSSSSRLR